MKKPYIYSTCVPSCVSSIGIVVNELLNMLRGSCPNISENTLFELKVILNEVMINAIRHGNKEVEEKLVKVDASLSERGIMSIVVEDEGGGYDFSNICGGCKPFCDIQDLFETSESGRGIMIIKYLCEDLKVNEKGNKIMITKRIIAE